MSELHCLLSQLIEDKRSLSERCDHLHLELKNCERKHQETVRNMEQRHAAELRRVKSLQETSSKLKQEKWLDEKTKRIKEQTGEGIKKTLTGTCQDLWLLVKGLLNED